MEPNINPVETNFPNVAKPEHSSGPIIGAVVLVITLVLAGVYMMKQSDMQIAPVETTLPAQQQEESTPLSAETDPETAALTEQGTSDEVAAIEADLSATDLEALTAFIDEI